MRPVSLLAVLICILPSHAQAETDVAFSQQSPFSYEGRSEMLALARAYPSRITDVEFRDGDWAIELDGRWFYWTDGRILPQEERSNYDRYTSHRFYSWEPGLPPLREIDAETADRIARRVEEMDETRPTRYPGFLNALYGAEDRASTLARIVDHRFYGFRVQVHRDLVAPLNRVEADLRIAARTNPEIDRFFETIRLIGAFSWRVIAGTGTRSYHSYGAAVDLIPFSYGRKHAYWRWALDAGVEEWWAAPYERRWMPPLSVIQIFEEHGFVWGGRWLFFDTIHFEYRPEIRILARLDGARRQELRRGTSAVEVHTQ